MSVHVVTVEVEARVGDIDLPVEEVVVTNAVNAIPQVELRCSPTESDGRGINVKQPVVLEYMDLYEKLADAAPGLNTEGEVSITATDHLDDSKDSITLEGWVLSGVGMSSVSTSGAPCLSVILQHPICRLTKTGGVYELPKTAYKFILATNGGLSDKYTEIVDKVYDTVAKADHWPTFSGKDNDMAAAFRKALAEQSSKPTTYLADETSVFLGPYLSDDMKKRMRLAEAIFSLPRVGECSTWDKLMEASGRLLVSIVQDEDNNYTQSRLLLAPTSPWKDPTVSIDDTMCEAYELPGMDPFRICGVMVDKLDAALRLEMGLRKDYAAYLSGNGSAVLYAPKGVTPSVSDGRIVNAGFPQLLLEAASVDSASGSGKLSETYSSGSKVYETAFNEQLLPYCRACYEMSCRSMVRTSVTSKLSFRDSEGRLILPGNSCTLKSNGDVLYYGYIQQVVHTMSTKGSCRTITSMSHVRRGPDYMIGPKDGKTVAIKGGSKSPIYNKEG